MSTIVTKEEAVVYKIRIEEPHHSWADITIREWPRGGSIDIQSDYGNFSYAWGSIGDRTLREFLCNLDYHYFMGKTRPSSCGRAFDISKTLKQLREDVISRRKERCLNKEEARECWIDICDIEEYAGNEEAEYVRALDMQHSLIRLLYDFEYGCIPYEYIDDPQCVAFWERIWPVVCQAWAEELREEKK
jgi:hypothetical protein